MHTRFKKNKKWLALMLFLPAMASSQGQILTGSTYFSNALFNTLLGIIVLLLIVIIALGQVLKNLAQTDYFVTKIKEKEDAQGKGGTAKTVGLIALGLFSLETSAQSSGGGSWHVGGLDMFTFYFMAGVILLEIIFVILLIHTLHYLLRSDVAPKTVQPEKKEKSILEKLNASVEIENEEEILMEHEYDGIRELDNDLPPWWRYGFYLTILVAVVYLIHFHVAGTGDLQIAEYNKEVERGKAAVAEFMRKSADNVDETTVKMMEGNDLTAGKQMFISVCAACHGKLGEGGVGPNLTDEYWRHGGSLPDIFKSVKYGWPDKGMKSWKEDLSPVQIAQVASFIKTLKGTNPPKAKAPEGDLFMEETESVRDSASTAADTLNEKTLPSPDNNTGPEKK